ncbi:MAG TPA: SDR family oxidoreductase [Candidatus Margulisiibacteriota bacterium]|nr:SDR family oxidoreductase [Candidatus Margulisiibacteriota bacterium]
MQLRDKVAVVTGGAHGIGAALAHGFATEGARTVVIVDLDVAHAEAVAAAVGGIALQADVGVEADIVRVVRETEQRCGCIDLWCSNAGILFIGGVETPNAQWQKIWDVNVMAHVYAARAVLPGMLARGGGYLLHTASAAGLLSQIGSATYSVTKHAVLALAEWLSITHADQGIKVSVLCPQAVRTNMLAGSEDGSVAGVDGVLEPAQVAQSVIAGLADERFLILPHPQVAEYFRRKASDYDRWLGGMRRLQRRFQDNLPRQEP